MIPSVITFEEVKDSPSVRIDLPALLAIGSRIQLKVTLRRKNGNRSEELRVDGEYRVTESLLDATSAPSKQLLRVTAKGLAPSWKAVRNQPSPVKQLAPTHSKVVIE